MDDALALLVVLVSWCMMSSILGLGAGWVWYNRKKTSLLAGRNNNSTERAVSIDNGETGKTSITFYGGTPEDDNRVGLTGIDLDAHGKAGFKFNGKPVYAGAVHQYAGSKFLYKVLEVSGDVNPLYIHVVDVCDEKDSVCNKNVKAHGNNFLVDIFQTGFKAAGKSDGILNGTYKVVGEIPPSKIPKNVWKEKYVMTQCTGKCAEKERKWVSVNSIK